MIQQRVRVYLLIFCIYYKISVFIIMDILQNYMYIQVYLFIKYIAMYNCAIIFGAKNLKEIALITKLH